MQPSILYLLKRKSLTFKLSTGQLLYSKVLGYRLFGVALAIATANQLLHYQAISAKQSIELLIDIGFLYNFMSQKKSKKLGFKVQAAAPVVSKLANRLAIIVLE